MIHLLIISPAPHGAPAAVPEYTTLGMPLNALTPIVLTESGTCSSVILVHPENALFPMLVIVFGIVTLTRLVQPEKALSPMLVPGGIIAVSREVQF